MGVEAETALNRQGLPNTLCYYAFDMDITKGADIRLSELHPVGFPLRRNDANGAVAPPTVPTEPVPEPVPEPMPEPRTAAVSNGAAASNGKRKRVDRPMAGTDSDFEDVAFNVADFEVK